MNALIQFYKSIFSFKGKTSRKDYWLSITIHSIILILLTLLLTPFAGHKYIGEMYGIWVQIIVGAVGVYILLIVIGLQTIYFRRMRDAGQTNFTSIILFILNLIPYVSFVSRIYTIYLLLKPSFKYDSKFLSEANDKKI